MKKIAPFIAMCMLILIGESINAQHLRIKVRQPHKAFYTPVISAQKNAKIWIGPEWIIKDGIYISVPGYWTTPNKPGMIWIAGKWGYRHGRKYWYPGYWK